MGVELRCGDALEILPTLADASVDAIITDPPYGTEAERDGYGRRANKRYIAGDKDLSAIVGMLSEAKRILRSDSWLAFFCSPKRRYEVETACRDAGLPVHGEVVWDKRTPGLGGGIRYQHETILLCRNGEPEGRDSLFSVISEMASRSRRHGDHPHEKPLKVMAALVRYCSRPGDLVVDPFVGTGTTLVACMKSGRRGFGIEIDPAYIPIIERRLSAAETPLLSGACL